MSSSSSADPLNEPPAVEGEAVSGVVTDFEGIPLVGVRVEAAESGGGDLDQLPVLTDGDGRFVVEGLAAGMRYDLRFSLGTVRARTLAVPVGTDQLRVKLARPQGILLDIKTPGGSPEPDLYYVVLERDAPPRPIREYFGRSVRPRMLLWSIRPGRYTVTVWGGPYLPVRADGVVVAARQSAPHVEVLLSAPGGLVGGEVTDREGNACPALVSWRRVDAPGHAPRHMTTSPTDERGAFVIRGLPEGRYRIAACCETNGLAQVEVDVVEQQSCSVTLRLR
jgi:Carboxypeptidase regulatory-like domain